MPRYLLPIGAPAYPMTAPANLGIPLFTKWFGLSDDTPEGFFKSDKFLRWIQSDPSFFDKLTPELQAMAAPYVLEALKYNVNTPSTAVATTRASAPITPVAPVAPAAPAIPAQAVISNNALKFATPADTARTAPTTVVNPQAAVPVANPKGGIPVVQESAIQPVVAKLEEAAPVIVVPVKEKAAAPVQQQAKPKPAGRPTYNGTISDDQITRGLKNAADIWKGVYKNAPVRWQKMTDAGISNDDQAIALYIVNRQDAEKKNAVVRQALENTISSIPTQQITIAETKAPSADILIPKRKK